MSAQGSKVCPTCKTEKPADEFPLSAHTPDGRMGRCKPCHARINRAYRATDKGRQNHTAANRRWRDANRARNLAAREADSAA